MNELLLATGEEFQEDEGTTIFLYDPETESDLMGVVHTYTKYGTVTPDDLEINGHKTLKLGTNVSGMQITFATPFNLQDKDWTLEWSFRNTVSAGTAYATELTLPSAVAGQGILSRWGDTGFGNRLQVGGSMGAVNSIWNPPISKAASLNVDTNMALSCKNGRVSVFRNGVLQMLANGTGGVYNTPNYPVGANLSSLAYMQINSSGSGMINQLGNRGRIRLSLGARYTRNYTIKPLELD
uniref:Tail fiber protein n=1 Tax=Pseudomonas phage RVTF4 TaxID=3236931 RepID=A0AB39CCS2_9VIRU